MPASHSDPFGLVGQTVDGKFRIDEVVGEGGFGVVYRALHLGLGEPVAVKCLKIPPNLPADDRERFHQAFLEEGRILRKLSRSTAAVVHALDIGAATAPNGVWTPYLVLEWLRGECLEKTLAERRNQGLEGLSMGDAIALLEPAAMAVAAAHDDGIAHRDIKPANFFTTDIDGVPTMKVLDFGIAKIIVDNASITKALEQTGKTPSTFTPHYGAPEQFHRRFGATGPWTDVYALVLVEMTSGKSPLEGDDLTQLYIATADKTIRPTPRTRGARTSDAVEAVFQKALCIEPRGRYTSVRVFWRDLRDAVALAPEEPDVRPDAPLPEPVLVSESRPRRTPARTSSRRTLFAAVGSITFVILCIGASIAIRTCGTQKAGPAPTTQTDATLP